MVQVVPAILALDEESFRGDLKRVEEVESLKGGRVHVDLMDGQFVEDQSVGPEILEKYPPEFQVEVHLMVKNPISMFDELKKGGAKRVIFHSEVGNTEEIISEAKSRGFEVGLAINPETELDQLQPSLAELDSVLVMSVHPGAQGQEFIAESLKKIKEILRLRSGYNLNFRIGADGGINEEVVKSLTEAGVDYLVIGSHLIRGNIDENFKKIKEAINS
jgi:ribulose-phosphate 3-epimerase